MAFLIISNWQLIVALLQDEEEEIKLEINVLKKVTMSLSFV